jgi:hypothetical protein
VLRQRSLGFSAQMWRGGTHLKIYKSNSL